MSINYIQNHLHIAKTKVNSLLYFLYVLFAWNSNIKIIKLWFIRDINSYLKLELSSASIVRPVIWLVITTCIAVLVSRCDIRYKSTDLEVRWKTSHQLATIVNGNCSFIDLNNAFLHSKWRITWIWDQFNNCMFYRLIDGCVVWQSDRSGRVWSEFVSIVTPVLTIDYFMY